MKVNKEMKKRKNEPISLFIDSGAFSAFTQKISIDITEYIKFLKDNQHVIDIYANLDVIGDAEATYQNQLIMEKAGLTPIPTFHMNEDFKYLELYINKYNYIALGGMAKVNRSNKTILYKWLDKCFSLICDEQGYPKVKVHGFAATSISIMVRYPWYSVDSTSWILASRYGIIYIPKENILSNVYKIGISNQSPMKEIKGRHFSNLSPQLRDKILSKIEEKGYQVGKSHFKEVSIDYKLEKNEINAGKTAKGKRIEIIEELGLSNNYKERDKWNVQYFRELQDSFPPYNEMRFKVHTRKRLF